MEKITFDQDTTDPKVIAAQIGLVRRGRVSLHPEESSLTDEDFQKLEAGKYSELSIKAQYWVGKYFTEGVSLRDKELKGIQKAYMAPATMGDVTRIAHEFIYGEGGVGRFLLEQLNTVTTHAAIVNEALRLKGLLTNEDLEAAMASLKAQQPTIVTPEGPETGVTSGLSTVVGLPEEAPVAPKPSGEGEPMPKPITVEETAPVGVPGPEPAA